MVYTSKFKLQRVFDFLRLKFCRGGSFTAGHFLCDYSGHKIYEFSIKLLLLLITRIQIDKLRIGIMRAQPKMSQTDFIFANSVLILMYIVHIQTSSTIFTVFFRFSWTLSISAKQLLQTKSGESDNRQVGGNTIANHSWDQSGRRTLEGFKETSTLD